MQWNNAIFDESKALVGISVVMYMSAYFIDDSISTTCLPRPPVSHSALPTGKMDEGLGIALPTLARLFTGMHIFIAQCPGLLRLVSITGVGYLLDGGFTNLRD